MISWRFWDWDSLRWNRWLFDVTFNWICRRWWDYLLAFFFWKFHFSDKLRKTWSLFFSVSYCWWQCIKSRIRAGLVILFEPFCFWELILLFWYWRIEYRSIGLLIGQFHLSINFIWFKEWNLYIFLKFWNIIYFNRISSDLPSFWFSIFYFIWSETTFWSNNL